MAPEAEPGVPLGHFLDHHPGTRVALWCNACLRVTRHPIPDVIAKLEAEGLDGRAFGIRALAWRVKEPCKVCGKMEWETRPDFPQARMGLGAQRDG